MLVDIVKQRASFAEALNMLATNLRETIVLSYKEVDSKIQLMTLLLSGLGEQSSLAEYGS